MTVSASWTELSNAISCSQSVSHRVIVASGSQVVPIAAPAEPVHAALVADQDFLKSQTLCKGFREAKYASPGLCKSLQLNIHFVVSRSSLSTVLVIAAITWAETRPCSRALYR